MIITKLGIIAPKMLETDFYVHFWEMLFKFRVLQTQIYRFQCHISFGKTSSSYCSPLFDTVKSLKLPFQIPHGLRNPSLLDPNPYVHILNSYSPRGEAWAYSQKQRYNKRSGMIV